MSIQELHSLGISTVASPPLTPHRFAVEQYHRMIESGVFSDGDRVELLEGLILEMTPIGIPHRYTVQELMKRIMRLLPETWDIFVGQPITLATSEPQPDLTVVRGKNSDYPDRNPGPGDIGLIIEVADSSLQVDRGTKSRIYAATGIPEFWIVDVANRQVEIHRDPRPSEAVGAAYQSCEIILATGKLPLVLDGRSCGEISVAAILP
jgi:Uma2 family endonuclease